MSFDPYHDLKSTWVAVDYDGTLVDDNLEYDIGAIKALSELTQYNIKLILWSCRPREYLEKVREELRLLGVSVELINENCQEIKDAYDEESRKIFCHFYLDNQSCGYRKVDWKEIEVMILAYHFKRVKRGDCNLV